MNESLYIMFMKLFLYELVSLNIAKFHKYGFIVGVGCTSFIMFHESNSQFLGKIYEDFPS